MKKMAAVLTALVLLVVPLGLNVSAAMPENPSEIMPMFNYISNANCSLIITSTGKASFNANINGYSEVLMIEIYVRLQKKNGSTWTDIAANNVVAYDDFAVCEGTYYLVNRGTYRAEATFTVYTADDVETIVSYSSQKTY